MAKGGAATQFRFLVGRAQLRNGLEFSPRASSSSGQQCGRQLPGAWTRQHWGSPCPFTVTLQFNTCAPYPTQMQRSQIVASPLRACARSRRIPSHGCRRHGGRRAASTAWFLAKLCPGDGGVCYAALSLSGSRFRARSRGQAPTHRARKAAPDLKACASGTVVLGSRLWMVSKSSACLNGLKRYASTRIRRALLVGAWQHGP